MNLGLSEKVAIITGGSEGIGRAAAASLAREGASVVICARRPDVLEEAAAAVRHDTGGTVIAIPADVRRQEDLENLVNLTVERLGPPTILINNAGTSAAAPFDALDDDTWGADLDLKLHAAIRLSRLVIPSMKQAGGGRIINVTAIAGKTPGAGSLPTSVSRAAGIALTKAMSKDLARYNILVNTVCIGLIKSGQISRAAGRRFPDLPLDQAYERMGEALPLGRVGEAEEAADLITFLVSERAAYITGAAINMDGGSSAST